MKPTLLTATIVRIPHCRPHPLCRPSLLALVALALGLGCTRANPAYRGAKPDAGGGGGAAGDAGIDTAVDVKVDTGIDTKVDTKTDVSIDTTTDRPPDVAGDAPKVDAGDAGFVCANVNSCMTRFGAPPCGSWTCSIAGVCLVSCSNCTDNDGDGYGVGSGCAGLDCDDTDPTITTVDSRDCPAGASKVGTCRPGTQSCTAGVWSACIGNVVPSGEACNGQDDNCNSTVDDGLPTISCGLGACVNTVPSCNAGALAVCTPKATVASSDTTCDGKDDDCDGLVDEDCQDSCLHVSPDGDDSLGDGSVMAPYLTIPQAISKAVLAVKNVCVAGGASCQDHTTYTVANGSTAPLNVFQMANGVSVYGNFESTGWTRCDDVAGATLAPTTTLDVRENGGVRFSNAINSATTLDGFVITRNGSGSSATPSIAAVTVDGATGVQLSNLVVNDSPSAKQTFGVNMINGAQAVITHSLIFGGAGADAFGVSSLNSTPTIRDNCAVLDSMTGRCKTDCTGTLGMGIGGRTDTATSGGSTAVLLDTSPGALVETSTICGAQGAKALGVHITNDATGMVIRASSISGSAGAGSSFGILIEGCNKAAPWIAGNELIQGQGTSSVAGIVAQGACAPVIDGNALITNGGSSTTTESDGVLCQADVSGVASSCAVLGNGNIQGLSGARPLVSVGIACKAGACDRVANNVVNGSSAVNQVYGVWLLKDGTMVDRNRIAGGCGGMSTVGLLADDSFARVQNNLITAGTCTGSTISTFSPVNIGVQVVSANDLNETDVDSNTIDGGGNAGSLLNCTSTAVQLNAEMNAAPTSPKGIFRNNIMSGGVCSPLVSTSGGPRTDFAESVASTDPRLFQNNDLNKTGTPAPTLYLDEGTTARNLSAVNSLTDTTSSGNINDDPLFTAPPTDLSLSNGSPCKSAGTSTGAPVFDFAGTTRSSTKPSIGAYE